jgi:hypothetical protein
MDHGFTLNSTAARSSFGRIHPHPPLADARGTFSREREKEGAPSFVPHPHPYRRVRRIASVRAISFVWIMIASSAPSPGFESWKSGLQASPMWVVMRAD